MTPVSKPNSRPPIPLTKVSSRSCHVADSLCTKHTQQNAAVPEPLCGLHQGVVLLCRFEDGLLKQHICIARKSDISAYWSLLACSFLWGVEVIETSDCLQYTHLLGLLISVLMSPLQSPLIEVGNSLSLSSSSEPAVPAGMPLSSTPVSPALLCRLCCTFLEDSPLFIQQVLLCAVLSLAPTCLVVARSVDYQV